MLNEGTMLNGRYEILGKMAPGEWQMFIKEKTIN